MKNFYFQSPAKINLMLEITGKEKATGYHKINTLICTLEDYFDLIEIAEDSKFSVKTLGEYAFEGENILEKTAKIFSAEFKGNINFKVNITKNIKTGAGLGGGSGNAGIFLNFLLKQNNISLSKKDYSELAFKIGADVPFFYDKTPKICKSFGEELHEVSFKMPQELYALIALPEFHIDTKSIFKLFKEEDCVLEKKFSSFEEILLSKNSLTKYASLIRPEISEIINTLKYLPNVLNADMSGSGSACFALFANKSDAEIAQKKLKNEFKCIISKLIL